MADYPYKARIEETVTALSDRFSTPDAGAREFHLQNRCKADFCFNIKPNGMLFIEDDDGARGVNNLIKYWIWCEANPDNRPVHFIHILETSRPAQIENIKFLANKMEKTIPEFNFHIIEIANWQAPYEQWLPELLKILNKI